MIRDGKILPFHRGQVLDLDNLPDGVEMEPGQEVMRDGRRWKVDTLPHCYDDLLVLARQEEGERWCSVCGDVPVGECRAVGPFHGEL